MKNSKDQKEEIYNHMIDLMQKVTCEMIIAELESIREEINIFIDELIEEKVKKYNDNSNET